MVEAKVLMTQTWGTYFHYKDFQIQYLNFLKLKEGREHSNKCTRFVSAELFSINENSFGAEIYIYKTMEATWWKAT